MLATALEISQEYIAEAQTGLEVYFFLMRSSEKCHLDSECSEDM